MRAVVIAIKDNKAAVAASGGNLGYIDDNGYEVGQILELKREVFALEEGAVQVKPSGGTRSQKIIRLYRFSRGIAAACILAAFMGGVYLNSSPAYTVTLGGDAFVTLDVNMFDRVVGASYGEMESGNYSTAQFKKLDESYEVILSGIEDGSLGQKKETFVTASVEAKSFIGESRVDAAIDTLVETTDSWNEEKTGNPVVLDLSGRTPIRPPYAPDEGAGAVNPDGTSPQGEKTDNAPGQAVTEPGKTDDIPGGATAEPGKTEGVPGATAEEPGKAENVTGKTAQDAEKTEDISGGKAAEPEKTEDVPRGTVKEPKREERTNGSSKESGKSGTDSNTASEPGKTGTDSNTAADPGKTGTNPNETADPGKIVSDLNAGDPGKTGADPNTAPEPGKTQEGPGGTEQGQTDIPKAGYDNNNGGSGAPDAGNNSGATNPEEPGAPQADDNLGEAGGMNQDAANNPGDREDMPADEPGRDAGGGPGPGFN